MINVKRWFALLTVLLGCAGIARAADGPALPVTVTVTEPSGVARPAWPVTGGVPLPQGAVRSADELALLDAAGKAVPGQIEPVCKWPDGSLKWVHVSFSADLPAKGKIELKLAKGKRVPVSGALKVSESAGAITIDTGAAKVVISKKRGSIVESLTVGGKQLLAGKGLELTGAAYVSRMTRRTYKHSKYTNMPISTPAATGKCGTEKWTIRPIDAENVELVGSVTGADGKCPRKFKGHWKSKSGKILLFPNYLWSKWGFGELSDKTYWTFETEGGLSGKTLSSLSGKVGTVTLEKKGPLVACVYVVGTFATKDGKPLLAVGKDKKGRPYPDASGDFFKYRVRIYAYAGKPYVYVIPAITHAGPIDGTPPAWFQDLGLRLDAPELAGGSALTLGGAAGKLGKEARLLQLLGEDALARRVSTRNRRTLSYAAVFDGQEKSKGAKAVGNLISGRLAVGVRRFWEYGPKALSARPGEVSVELWPKRADGVSYSLCMGRQRSHELLLGAAGEKELAAFQAPRLVAVAPGGWYADCGVFGMVAEERDYAKGKYPEEQLEALARFERLQKCKVDPKLAVRRGGKPGNVLKQFIPGWYDYGDLPWAEDWSNLHYDWTMSMLLHFLRTGKRELFDAADAMAWHRKDIAQNHCGLCGRRSDYKRWSNHLTYYEKDDHRSVGQGPKPSHTWNRGMAYWYLVTGDPMAREVAVNTAEGLRGFYARFIEGKAKMTNAGAELRMYGWTIENFLGAYEVTGDKKYLDWAVKLCRSSFGAIREGKTVEKAKVMHPLMYGYSLSPLCRLHHYTKDKEVLKTIRYLVDEALLKRFLKLGHKTKDGKYLFSGTPYGWKKAAWEAGKLKYSGAPWNLFWANPFAYLHMSTGEEKYLKLSRQLFRESMYYYAASYSPKDPKYRCNLAYFDGMFSSTATKAHGWSGRFNQIYLYMEKEISKGRKFTGK